MRQLKNAICRRGRVAIRFAFIFVAAFSVIGAANADLITGAGLGLGAGVGVFALGVVGGFALPITAGLGISIFTLSTIFGVTFDSPSQANSTASTAALTVYLNPKTPLPVPAGWSAATGSNIQPTPPATGQVLRQYNPMSRGMQTMSAGSACAIQAQSYGTIAGGAPAAINPSVTGETATVLSCSYTSASNGSTLTATVNAQSAASPGYTLSGTYPSQVANLSSASQVQKGTINQADGSTTGDGKRAIIRSGNTFTADPQDIYDTLPSNVVGSGTGTICVYGNDGSVGCASAASDGTSTVTQTTPNTDGKTSTRTTMTGSAPDASTGAVQITGYKKEIVDGVGAPAAGATSAPALTPGYIGSGTTDVSNLATHADINGLKAGQCGAPGESKCAIDETGTPSAMPESIASLNTSADGHAADVQSKLDTMPRPTDDFASDNPLNGVSGGTCTPIVTTGWGVVPSLSLNVCPMADTLRPLIDWLLWTLAVVFLIYRFRSVSSGVSE